MPTIEIDKDTLVLLENAQKRMSDETNVKLSQGKTIKLLCLAYSMQKVTNKKESQKEVE